MQWQEQVRTSLRNALDKPSGPFAADTRWSLAFLKKVGSSHARCACVGICLTCRVQIWVKLQGELTEGDDGEVVGVVGLAEFRYVGLILLAGPIMSLDSPTALFSGSLFGHQPVVSGRIRVPTRCDWMGHAAACDAV